MILDQLFNKFLNNMKMLFRKSLFRNKYTITMSVLSLCYFTLYNYSDYSHCSINRNIFTGSMNIDTIPGHNLTFPWIQVVQIDLKPCRIPILSNSRTFNYKLVRFNPNFIENLLTLKDIDIIGGVIEYHLILDMIMNREDFLMY